MFSADCLALRRECPDHVQLHSLIPYRGPASTVYQNFWGIRTMVICGIIQVLPPPQQQWQIKSKVYRIDVELAWIDGF